MKISKSNIKLFFQPICCVISGRIMGFETLIRIIKGNELNSPQEFVLMSERDGSISKVDYYVIEKVMNFLSFNEVMGNFITVNVSSITFSKTNFATDIIKLYSKFVALNKQICFEITETAKGDISTMAKNAEKLQEFGFGVYLDDFGSGYNAFGLLSQINASAIKVSKDVLDTLKDKRTNLIISRFVSLFQELSAKVILEGIEDKMQLELAKQLGFDYVQGYYLGKPSSAERYIISVESDLKSVSSF